MQKTPDISIVVSNRNSSDLLNEAFESIVLSVGDIDFDVFVIDDVSSDGGFAHVDEKYKNDPRFTFIQNEVNVGFAAVNVILPQTQAKYILTLDADARLKPGTLLTLFKFMETHSEVGAATGNLLNPDGSFQNYYRRLMTPLLCFYTTPMGRFLDKYFMGLRYYKWYHYIDLDFTKLSELEQPPVACLILRREALGDSIFDPDYRLLFIDVDLCKRLYNKGYKIFLVPDAPATHIKSVSFAKRSEVSREREYYRALNIYFKKNYPLYAPLMWVMLKIDVYLRMLLIYTVGKAPMR
ncbi:glycosyltransferase [Acetobacteraceae bacterium]|nr:glycosyltransferase [Candidatus Parcubacteria bacterium]